LAFDRKINVIRCQTPIAGVLPHHFLVRFVPSP
jgi:hypothetical protein